MPLEVLTLLSKGELINKPINVTVWNEFRHEKTNAAVKKIYPDGMHAANANAVHWAAPRVNIKDTCPNVKPI